MTLLEKIKLAITYISNNENEKYKYSIFYKIYPFSTENLTGFFKEELINNRSILLTGSSADQIITSQLFNSKKITCYDINPFVEFLYDLKIAAIKNLELDNFINFFYTENKNEKALDYRTYQKIRNDLTSESKKFWDTLYSIFSPIQIKQQLFNSCDLEYDLNKYKKIIPYLKKDNYYLLKDREFESVEFLECNVLDITNKIKDSYDIIYFSNIFSRLEMISIYNNHYIKNLYKFFSDILPYVNENGKILLDYFYGVPKKDFENKPWTYHVRFPVRYFKCESAISYLEVSSVSHNEDIDTVLVYTKTMKKGNE